MEGMNVRKKTGVRLLGMFLSVVLLLGVALSPPKAGADETRDQISHLGWPYLKRFALDFKDVALSPGHWKGNDFLLLGGVAVITGALYAVDGDVADWVVKHRSTSSGPVPRFLSRLAEPPFLGGLMAALYVSGEAFRSPGLRQTALLSLEAYAANAVIHSAIKFLVGRTRYSKGEGDRSFHPFSSSFTSRSFPSGHSGSAFAVAAIVAGQVDKPAVGALVYGLAGAIAISRIHDNEHWASDIFAGSALGYFIGKMILHLNRPSSTKSSPLGVSTLPGGLSFSLRF